MPIGENPPNRALKAIACAKLPVKAVLSGTALFGPAVSVFSCFSSDGSGRASAPPVLCVHMLASDMDAEQPLPPPWRRALDSSVWLIDTGRPLSISYRRIRWRERSLRQKHSGNPLQRVPLMQAFLRRRLSHRDSQGSSLWRKRRFGGPAEKTSFEIFDLDRDLQGLSSRSFPPPVSWDLPGTMDPRIWIHSKTWTLETVPDTSREFQDDLNAETDALKPWIEAKDWPTGRVAVEQEKDPRVANVCVRRITLQRIVWHYQVLFQSSRTNGFNSFRPAIFAHICLVGFFRWLSLRTRASSRRPSSLGAYHTNCAQTATQTWHLLVASLEAIVRRASSSRSKPPL